MTIATASEPFFTHCQVERLYAPQTQTKVRDCFSSWILPFFGSLEVTKLNRIHILNLRQAMSERQISPARQTSVLVALKVFLQFCRTVLRIDCLDPAEIRLPPKTKPTPDWLTPEEVQRMVDAPNVNSFTGLRLRAFIELLLATGLRLGEALSLDREPFDQRVAEMDVIGKGEKKRTIFFTERCRFWIVKYLSVRADKCPALFVTTGGEPRRWSKMDISRYFGWLKNTSGITKKLTPHILRHTFCTTLLNNGVDITFIRDLAGHSDIQTTARYYLGVDKEALRKIVKKHVRYESELHQPTA